MMGKNILVTYEPDPGDRQIYREIFGDLATVYFLKDEDMTLF